MGWRSNWVTISLELVLKQTNDNTIHAETLLTSEKNSFTSHSPVQLYIIIQHRKYDLAQYCFPVQRFLNKDTFTWEKKIFVYIKNGNNLQ